MAPLAATTLAEGGDRQSSRFLWTQLLNSDIEWVRNNAGHRLQQLDAMDVIEAVNRELAAGRRLSDVPVDPTGVPYRLDPATGRIDLDPKSELSPLPWEPGAAKPS
jgi:hypothetical protein